MKRKRTIIVITILSFVLLCVNNSSFAVSDEDSLIARLRKEIKDEVYAELKTDLERMVKEEVQKELELRLAEMLSTDANIEQLSSALPENATLAEIINHTVRQTINEQMAQYDVMAHARVQQISDEELDKQIAGEGIQPNTVVTNDFRKESLQQPVIQLAAVSAPSSSSMTDTDMDETVAGGEKAESIERTLQQKGSVLLPKGTLQIEPSLNYAHFSSSRINIQGLQVVPIVIGDVTTETVRRDILFWTLAAKYGMLDNLQGEIRIPYRFQYDRISNNTLTSETTRNTNGLGDVELGLSRQIGWESGIMPDLIAGISVKPPSGRSYGHDIGLGTGHWSVRTSLVAAKSSDPVVVFGSLSYISNIKRNDIPDFGTIDPGDSFAYSVGTAIALSYQTAINFSFDNSITMRTERNNAPVIGSFLNSANFKAGINWATSQNSSVDLSIGFGLTDDSPDFTVSLRVPYVF
ncbi:MAG: transporter [Candidatus Omnitrophica bacterium]|nr:transporter [Candidatus Omnitrophota bacterium]